MWQCHITYYLLLQIFFLIISYTSQVNKRYGNAIFRSSADVYCAWFNKIGIK